MRSSDESASSRSSAEFSSPEIQPRPTLDDALWTRVSDDARVLADTFDDVVLFLSASGEVKALNRAATEMLPTPAGMVRRLPVDDLATDFWRGVALAVERVRRSRGTVRRVVFEPATRSWWDVRCAKLENGGEPREDDPEIVVVARDISELTELQRAASERKSLSAMGALLAGVAHEVRNPLFAISATLDAFDLQHAANPGVSELALVLRREVGRLSRLMGDLLEYGRPIATETGDVSVVEVIRLAVEECSAAAHAEGIEVRIDIAGSPAPVRGDRRALTLAFVNLIRNAIQHTRRGGVVDVGACEVVEQDASWIDCFVADRGPGFSRRVLEHVFEPFFSRRRGGTGLGLALAHRVFAEHRGRVVAANRAGGGAIMMVHLPASSESAGERTAAIGFMGNR